jgi:TetR/AcrR family transcriptional regulator, regulator of cefoperazone and chloramphenicol sensitivity
MAEATISPEGDTRTRLLEAGLRLFAVHGFEAVTTRRLAAEADANIAAINYHFGGMKNLYHAVARQFVEETEPQFAPLRDGITGGVKAAGDDRVALARLAARWAEGMLRTFLGDARMRWRAGLVAREYAQPSDAFDILYEGRIGPMHEAVSELVAAAVGRDSRDPETIILTHSVIGQVIVFGIARVVLWRRLDWDEQTSERLDLIVRTVTTSVVATLGLPAIEEEAPGPRAGDGKE